MCCPFTNLKNIMKLLCAAVTYWPITIMLAFLVANSMPYNPTDYSSTTEYAPERPSIYE